jgi:hypothetical protein
MLSRHIQKVNKRTNQGVGIKVLMLGVTSEDESLLQASVFREAVIITDRPAISIYLFGQHSYDTVSKIPISRPVSTYQLLSRGLELWNLYAQRAHRKRVPRGKSEVLRPLRLTRRYRRSTFHPQKTG